MKCTTPEAKAAVDEAQMQEVSAAVESLILADIHKKLFGGLVELYVQEERALAAALVAHQGVTMEDLGVRPEVVCNATAAVEKLCCLDSYVTPLEKLCCLEDVNQLLQAAVHEQFSLQDAGDKEDIVLAADDILPLTTYVVIKAFQEQPSLKLKANQLFLEHFLFLEDKDALEVGRLRVHFVNFQGALGFVAGGAGGGAGPQPFSSSSSSSSSAAVAEDPGVARLGSRARSSSSGARRPRTRTERSERSARRRRARGESDREQREMTHGLNHLHIHGVGGAGESPPCSHQPERARLTANSGQRPSHQPPAAFAVGRVESPEQQQPQRGDTPKAPSAMGDFLANLLSSGSEVVAGNRSAFQRQR